MNAQDEIDRLKREIERLQQALGERQQLTTPNPPALINDAEFILAMARFSEGLLSEQEARRRWNFSEAQWTAMGDDAQLVERIAEEKLARVRSGAAKREKAQKLIVKGPDILDSIATNAKASDKHKIDAVKALDGLADPGAQAAHDNAERVIVTIDLGADHKLVFNKSVKPDPNDRDPNDKLIDVTPAVPGFNLEGR